MIEYKSIVISRDEIVCFVMREKKLRISSYDEAGEKMIGLAGETS